MMQKRFCYLYVVYVKVFVFQGYLSDSQMRLLMDYKQQLHQEKLQRLQNEFQKSWSDEQGVYMVLNIFLYPLYSFDIQILSEYFQIEDFHSKKIPFSHLHNIN